jgi:hypothetical protein
MNAKARKYNGAPIDCTATQLAPTIVSGRPASFRRWLQLWVRAIVRSVSGPCRPVFDGLVAAVSFEQIQGGSVRL